MATTITNEAQTSYQFEGSGDTMTVESNLNSVVLQDASGLTLTKTASPSDFLPGDIITFNVFKITLLIRRYRGTLLAPGP